MRKGISTASATARGHPVAQVLRVAPSSLVMVLAEKSPLSETQLMHKHVHQWSWRSSLPLTVLPTRTLGVPRATPSLDRPVRLAPQDLTPPAPIGKIVSSAMHQQRQAVVYSVLVMAPVARRPMSVMPRPLPIAWPRSCATSLAPTGSRTAAPVAPDAMRSSA
jgi:hypothetical protein